MKNKLFGLYAMTAFAFTSGLYADEKEEGSDNNSEVVFFANADEENGNEDKNILASDEDKDEDKNVLASDDKDEDNSDKNIFVTEESDKDSDNGQTLASAEDDQNDNEKVEA